MRDYKNDEFPLESYKYTNLQFNRLVIYSAVHSVNSSI